MGKGKKLKSVLAGIEEKVQELDFDEDDDQDDRTATQDDNRSTGANVASQEGNPTLTDMPDDYAELNLFSSMQDPADLVEAQVPEEPVFVPRRFVIPRDILQEASDLNTKLEETVNKVIGRQLAGSIGKLISVVSLGNAAAVKAGSVKAGMVRMTRKEYAVATIKQGAVNLRRVLAEETGLFYQRLEHAEVVPKMSLPPLWENTLTELIKVGLFTAPAVLSPSLHRVPAKMLQALGIAGKLGSPYTPAQLETIKHLETAIGILEKIGPLAGEMQNYKGTE